MYFAEKMFPGKESTRNCDFGSASMYAFAKVLETSGRGMAQSNRRQKRAQS